LTRSLFLALLPLLLVFALGADAPSWTSPPPPDTSVLALEEPPAWPEHWIVEEGLYASVGGEMADLAAVRRIAAHVEEAVPRIAEELALPTGRRMRVYVTHSQDQFESLQPGEPADWVDATAYPHRALIFLRAPRLRPGTAKPLEQVTDHEITHVLVEQGFHGAPVPRWLHEGLAQVVAKEYSTQTTEALAKGMLGDNLMSLSELVQGFPRDPLRAQLAYAQSADLVAFIRNEYGQPAVQQLLREMAGGTPVRAAFRHATGESLEDVDSAWRARLQSSRLWLPAIVSDSFFFAIGSLVLVGGWLRVRRRNRERRAWMEREEELQRQLDLMWAQRLGAGPEPDAEPQDPPWAAGSGVPRSSPADGWSRRPARPRIQGWLSDQRLADGLSEAEEHDPWDHPVPREQEPWEH
jgi:hypothetical protein